MDSRSGSCPIATRSSTRYREHRRASSGSSSCESATRNRKCPLGDLRNFVAWIFFNLYTGNNDSHAKNLSLLRVPGRGVTLSPFYDLMCTRLYPGLSQEFAFSIGGEVRPGSLTREHVEAMARELRMRPQFAISVAQELAKKMPQALEQAVEKVAPALPPAAQDMAERLRRFVASTTKKTAARIES